MALSRTAISVPKCSRNPIRRQPPARRGRSPLAPSGEVGRGDKRGMTDVFTPIIRQISIRLDYLMTPMISLVTGGEGAPFRQLSLGVIAKAPPLRHGRGVLVASKTNTSARQDYFCNLQIKATASSRTTISLSNLSVFCSPFAAPSRLSFARGRKWFSRLHNDRGGITSVLMTPELTRAYILPSPFLSTLPSLSSEPFPFPLFALTFLFPLFASSTYPPLHFFPLTVDSPRLLVLFPRPPLPQAPRAPQRACFPHQPLRRHTGSSTPTLKPAAPSPSPPPMSTNRTHVWQSH